MTEPVAPPPIPAEAGVHQLPASFGASPHVVPAAKRHKKRTGLLLTSLGIVVLGVACAGVQLGANLGYDDARVAFEAAADDAEEGQAQLTSELTTLNSATSMASGIADVDSGMLMDAVSKEALTAAITDATAASTDATSLSEQLLPHADDKPDWAWELFGETAQLNSDRDSADQLVAEFSSAGDDASGATSSVEDAALTAVTTAADAAAGFEAVHVSARNLDILALRNAADRVHGAATLDDAAQSAYSALESAASQMLTSEQAELAEKSGALYGARVEIEAFARSLAPGVLLDFDWSEIVNGYGYSDSMAGYATWWYADPGYATIELTNSVAALWPSARSEALVAHEVGHAISVKCEGMYDDSTQENIEAWGTAWAISMGYVDDANGTWAYGPPPQSLIDAAAGCR
ncbi:hypothetical protein DC31_10545 [Microbacterium sp. CH12i]|uniref:hypothetical protein n=1 Tax=Microbacterium sp. CH12i TaxID=1479651 RepID=UPI00046162D3|nr:hypothetical protein [Microbacterium sp. CH12i]KDA06391.1 hypothetical protein DC31_10545 [Microbacterium sp. CH12i]